MSRLLVAVLLAASIPLLQGQEQVEFHAAGIGEIEVKSSFPSGGFPTARFENKAGQLLYSMPVGSSDPDIFRIDEDEPSSSDLKYLGPSTLVYFVIQSKVRPTSVIAIAKYTGGSDCVYVPALAGPVNGKLKSWLQQEPVVNGQGGFYVGDLGHGRGFGLAAWSFIWEDGAHWGRHRYNVRLYGINPESGRSALVFKADTRRKYHAGTEALKEFGFRYDNILSHSRALGC